MNDLIEQIGIKAYSLNLLKEHGLFDGNLFISRSLENKEKFIKDLKKAGFGLGERMVVRFSHPNELLKLPRGIFSNVDELYEFLNENHRKDLTFIIYDFTEGKFGGTVSLVDGELIMEFIEGDWNADYVMNMDTVVFKDGKSKWYLYKEKRKVPYVENEVVKLREVNPLTDLEVMELFKKIKPKISNIFNLLERHKNDFNSVEFIISTDLKFKGIELHKIEVTGKDFDKKEVLDEYFELKTPHDLRRWDRKTKLLISIPASIDRADALLGIIHEIKKYTNSASISYGVLSHPAILLREAGINIERKISNYRMLDLVS